MTPTNSLLRMPSLIVWKIWYNMYDRYIDFTFDFGFGRCKLSDIPKDMMLAWTLLPIPQELKYRPYMFF